MNLAHRFAKLTLGPVVWAAICFSAVPGHAAGPLKWDAEEKEYAARTNESTARFSFSVTNVSTAAVVIHDVKPSCGCTLVSLPARPWKLAPGDHGTVQVDVDLKGKSGILIKTLNVTSSAGPKDLVFRVKIPGEPTGGMSLVERVRRLRNQEMAGADRQAVFKGDCARCHVTPAVGKTGKELFEKACLICHDPMHRASMVPDLTGLPQAGSREYWALWIGQGKEGSLMPGFARSAGGPLTEEQIQSLVDYLSTRKTEPEPASAPATRP